MAVVLVVVTSVAEVVVLVHYAQTGIVNLRVEEHQVLLQRQLMLDLHFQLLLELVVRVRLVPMD